MKTLLCSSKRKLEIKTSSTGESFRDLFTLWEIKHLVYPAFKRDFSIVLIALLKSEEILLALWKAAMIQFLFHFVGISNFQCVVNFPDFL